MFGRLSDSLGRKRAMFFSLGGTAAGSVINVLVVYCHWPLWVLVPASVINGICGNFPVVLMALFASVADISSRKNRTVRIAILEGCVYLGAFLGVRTGFYILFFF